jgi:Mce-associated membrane protein
LLAQLNVSSTQNGVAADSRSGMVIVSLEKQDGNWLISEIRDQ